MIEFEVLRSAIRDRIDKLQNLLISLVDAENMMGPLSSSTEPSVFKIPPPAVADLPAPQLFGKTERLKRGPKTAKKSSGAVRGRTKKSGGERSCSKHPGNTEWDSNGSCSPCRRAYQTQRRIDKGAKPRATKVERVLAEMRAPSMLESTRSQTVPTTIPKRPRADAEPKLVYSKLMRCSKCSHPATRFEKRADAGPDDMWTCLENDCQLRIGNYNIAVDRSYSGKGEAA